MASLAPYLFFNGNCREAMNFYRSCLGGELEVMTFGDAQGHACALAVKDSVMHATLRSKQVVIMASDRPDAAPVQGDNVCLSLNCDTLEEIESTFRALSQGGKIGQELHDAFWGDRFGMLVDRFGIGWMLNCPLKRPA